MKKIIKRSLYKKIKRVIPIPCVDLLVRNESGEILLLKRGNQPFKNNWWFPGGRVHFLETRKMAAIRKLKEECSLKPIKVLELGTYDLIDNNEPEKHHAITTLFLVLVNGSQNVILDKHSTETEWRTLEEWLREEIHAFVKDRIKNAKNFFVSNK